VNPFNLSNRYSHGHHQIPGQRHCRVGGFLYRETWLQTAK